MNKLGIVMGIAALATIMASSMSFAEAAEVDYFLKIPGVEGESQKAEHENEIDVLSWSWGATNDSFHRSSTQTSDGATTLSDLTVTLKQDKSTAKLMQACADGKHITDEVVLTARRAGADPQDYFLIKMKPVYITSYQTGGSSGDVVPVDTISLNFGEIKFEYKPQKRDPSGEDPPTEFAVAEKKPGKRTFN